MQNEPLPVRFGFRTIPELNLAGLPCWKVVARRGAPSRAANARPPIPSSIARCAYSVRLDKRSFRTRTLPSSVLAGAGSQLAELLGRLGVGSFLLIDPDRADTSNLPRLMAARRSDVLISEAQASRLPFGKFLSRLRRRKIDLAARNIRRANRHAVVKRVSANVVDDAIARRLLECDFIFLAADEMGARLVVNAIVQQYLIPAVQVGARVVADPDDGSISDVFAVSRPVFPGCGCLWCNGLIDPSRLAEEMTETKQRSAQAYGSESPAPSVASLNALATADAVNLFQFHMTGLARAGAHRAFRRFRPLRGDIRLDEPRRDENCNECGTQPGSRFARGDGIALPTR